MLCVKSCHFYCVLLYWSCLYFPDNLELWLDNLQNTVETVDYLGICGDLGSAYAPYPRTLLGLCPGSNEYC